MTNYKKELLLIFEGPDGAGKSSLIKELKQTEQFKDIEMLDRSTISDRAYAIKFNRDEISDNTYWESEFQKNRQTKVILCSPDASILALRCIDKNDPLARNRNYEQLVEQLQKDKELFESMTKLITERYSFDLLVLDTSLSKEDCIKQIKDFIEDAKI